MTELKVQTQNVERANGHLDTMGIIVTWSPDGEANLESIKKAFDAIGMGHMAPTPRTLGQALRAALVRQFSKKNRRVAPAGKGYEVLFEKPVENEVRIESEHVMSAWTTVEGGEEFVVCDVPEFTVDGETHTMQDVAEWVEAARRRTDGAAIGEALVSVGAALNGVAIRESGGGYWIPSSSIGRWMQLVEGLNAAGRPMRMRVWDTASSARSIESTIDSVSSLVDKKCDDIMAAIEKGNLGVRAIDSRTDEAVSLVAQLAEYEKVLGHGLEALKQKVLEVQTATVQAAMLAQAQKEQKMRDRRMATHYEEDLMVHP